MNQEKLETLGASAFRQNGADAVDSLAIIGGGTMGQGIAVLAAKRGVEVTLIEKDQESLDNSIREITESLDREISRWAMTESEKKSILSRIHGGVEFSQVGERRFIIEAVAENLSLKRSIFARLDQICVPEAVFITNTSTLSITELATATGRPDRVIGMHFLNPVTKVKVVEVVRGLKTSAETFRLAEQLAKKLERTAVEVYESPGYVTTRVMMPLVNEAIQILMEGVASASDIDTAVKLGYELPHGPLAMADQMGLDLVLNWLDTLFHDLGDPKYRPCPLLRMLVRAGHLGVKTGQGFFRYDSEGRIIPGSGQTPAAFKRFIGD